jgi:Flp pilus assembly pilin Flp
MTRLNRIWLLLRDDTSQAATEYALISMVIALAAVTAMHSFAGSMNHAFLMANRALAQVIQACGPHHGHH